METMQQDPSDRGDGKNRYTEYNASCQVKVQKDGFETVSHDFRNIFDN